MSAVITDLTVFASAAAVPCCVSYWESVPQVAAAICTQNTSGLNAISALRTTFLHMTGNLKAQITKRSS
ncbi:hypothetical protein PBY51_022303 [Eleginops maclovinus]|uniref:Secreted protein n=1 Tax=Eleginops maclovinus TaxID=56733 RepID=A0AAN7XAP5_ELEMC|nr:hypothetical protein PBY51_022303 [Eleginops maclovinus]